MVVSTTVRLIFFLFSLVVDCGRRQSTYFIPDSLVIILVLTWQSALSYSSHNSVDYGDQADDHGKVGKKPPEAGSLFNNIIFRAQTESIRRTRRELIYDTLGHLQGSLNSKAPVFARSSFPSPLIHAALNGIAVIGSWRPKWVSYDSPRMTAL